jgi:nicotinamidase/pyrazinamidase
VHIAHPISWVDSKGNHPAPFTQITLTDVENGTYRAFKPGLQRRFESYVRSLESNGRYVLTIWPPHCLIGSPGHAVHPTLFEALLEWERTVYGFVGYTPKGSNYLTEHYSAVVADVSYPDDPTTQLNTRFIQLLEEADDILITGEALNFCVANTFKDVADNFSNADYVKKLVLLEDACSEIPGLEFLTKAFMDDMLPRGMRIARTTDF